MENKKEKHKRVADVRFGLRFQPVDATLAINLSARVSAPHTLFPQKQPWISRSSFSIRPLAFKKNSDVRSVARDSKIS